MKIIPHPTVLKEKEAQLEEMQDKLIQKARELHVMEVMLNSQISYEKRQKIDRKILYFCFFLAGFMSGFLHAILIS